MKTGNTVLKMSRGKHLQIQIIGSKGQTHFWNMGYSDTHPTAPKFQKNEKDIFTICDQEVGRIVALNVRVPPINGKKW